MDKEPITLKSIIKLILEKRPALIYGQIITLIAIILAVFSLIHTPIC